MTDPKPRLFTDADVERAAIALSLADPDERGLPYGEEMAPFYRRLARAALEAGLSPEAQAVLTAIEAAGLKIVPVEPTPEMVAASESALAEWRKTLTRDEAMMRSYKPDHQRAFIASATPAEKHAIRYRAMVSAAPAVEAEFERRGEAYS